MSFLRRLFGGSGTPDDGTSDDAPADAGAASPDEAERVHERQVLRDEASRLDELQQRQLRYAEYAWTPPAQGGPERADDEDREEA